MTADSYLAEMENMQALVAQSLYDDEQAIYDALAPDGVPFGMQDHVLDNAAQLQQYMISFKDNPPAQQQWIADRVQESISVLDQAGVPVGMAAQNDTRVFEAACTAALIYSYKMEVLLRGHLRRNGNG